MPAAPELGDGLGQVGVVKVLNEFEAHDPAEADGHIGIAGEVKVDVQGKGDGVHPEEQDGLLVGFPEQLHQQSEIVGDDDLLGKAHEKPPQAEGHVLPAVGAGIQFPGNVHIPDNGTGDELGEQSHIGAEADGVLLRHRVAPVHVDGVGQALEGIEADADGQGQLQQGDTQAGDGVEAVHEEVGILENAKERHGNDDGHGEPDFFPHLFCRLADGKTAAVKQADGEDHQEHVLGLAPAVEHKAGQQQDRVFQHLGHGEVHQQHNGQEVI